MYYNDILQKKNMIDLVGFKFLFKYGDFVKWKFFNYRGDNIELEEFIIFLKL